MAQSSESMQAFCQWLDECQRQDAPWVYEQRTSDLPAKPIRGRGGKPTGKFEPTAREAQAQFAALYGTSEQDMATRKNRPAKPPEARGDQDLIRAQHASIAAILRPVDEIAVAMERKWGVDRLPALVPPDWSERFASALARMNRAIAAMDLIDLRERAAVMYRGWVKLDELATAAGHPVWQSPDIWEVLSPAGRLYAIARTTTDERNARVAKDARLITLDEVARIIDAWDEDGLITEIRAQIPGATIVKAGRIAPDDIPDKGA